MLNDAPPSTLDLPPPPPGHLEGWGPEGWGRVGPRRVGPPRVGGPKFPALSRAPAAWFGGAAGASHDSPRAQTCTFQGTCAQNTPRDTQKERNDGGKGKKKSEIWAVRGRAVRQRAVRQRAVRRGLPKGGALEGNVLNEAPPSTFDLCPPPATSPVPPPSLCTPPPFNFEAPPPPFAPPEGGHGPNPNRFCVARTHCHRTFRSCRILSGLIGKIVLPVFPG